MAANQLTLHVEQIHALLEIDRVDDVVMCAPPEELRLRRRLRHEVAVPRRTSVLAVPHVADPRVEGTVRAADLLGCVGRGVVGYIEDEVRHRLREQGVDRRGKVSLPVVDEQPECDSWYSQCASPSL